MSDQVANAISQIKNAQAVGKRGVLLPHSNFVKNLLEVMHREGYISKYDEVKQGKFMSLLVELKYYYGAPVIDVMKKASKSSCRIYLGYKKIKPFYNGMGIHIISTTAGLLTDKEAIARKLGGEVVCSIF